MIGIARSACGDVGADLERHELREDDVEPAADAERLVLALDARRG